MKTKVKLLSNPELDSMPSNEKERFFANQLHLREARNEGDTETVNNYVLGQLNYMSVNYTKV